MAEAHDFIRRRLPSASARKRKGIRLLYGGSANPGNARVLIAVDNVDGLLVGGASLKAADFLAMYGAYGELLA